MRERIKSFFPWMARWAASNLAWDVFLWIIRLVVSGVFWKIILNELPKGIIAGVDGILASVGLSAFQYLIVLIVGSFFVYGVISFASPPIKWIGSYILKSEKPNLVQEGEWNAIIDFDGRKVAVANISIKNKPDRITENSIAYGVIAHLDFFDKNRKHLLKVKCGYWTRTTPQDFFAESGNKKNCWKIDFYPHDTWNLPIVYRWNGEDVIFAYDHNNSINSKKLGKPPIVVSIVFEGEKLKQTSPIQYFIMPNVSGMDGVWMKKM